MHILHVCVESLQHSCSWKRKGRWKCKWWTLPMPGTSSPVVPGLGITSSTRFPTYDNKFIRTSALQWGISAYCPDKKRPQVRPLQIWSSLIHYLSKARIPWVDSPCLILQHHAGHICMVHPSPTLNDVTCQGYTYAHWSKLCVSFRYKRTYQTCHIPPSCLLESPCTLHHPSAHLLIPPIKLPTQINFIRSRENMYSSTWKASHICSM